MTKEEHKQILEQLRTSTSDVDRMALLVQLEQDYTGVLSELDTAVTTAQTATEECIKYAKLNNELWLANSSQEKAGKELDITGKESTEDTPPPKRTFEDLESKFE